MWNSPLLTCQGEDEQTPCLPLSLKPDDTSVSCVSVRLPWLFSIKGYTQFVILYQDTFTCGVWNACQGGGEPTHFICKSGGFRQKSCTNLKPDTFKEYLISCKAQLTWWCHLCVSFLQGSVFLALDKQQ